MKCYFLAQKEKVRGWKSECNNDRKKCEIEGRGMYGIGMSWPCVKGRTKEFFGNTFGCKNGVGGGQREG